MCWRDDVVAKRHCYTCGNTYTGDLGHRNCPGPPEEPTVIHILSEGYPLCGFSTDVPVRWPKTQQWVSIDDCKDANCQACKDKVPKGDPF